MNQVELFNRLTKICLKISEERDFSALLNSILFELQEITKADGGSLYVRKANNLEFAAARNISLFKKGGSLKQGTFKPIAIFDEHGTPNLTRIAVYSVIKSEAVNIKDVYSETKFSFDGVKKFDEENDYRTTSMLTIPLLSHADKAIGCLQLINAKDEKGNIIAFSKELEEISLSIASIAAIILDNKQLVEDQKNLLEAFIKVIAEAIDKKSPYTGNHCTRVPELTEMIAEAACQAKTGKFADFNMTEEQKYELHIAGWLHDCGKVVTPVHIMDKSTKLETIWDRIDMVKARFEVLKRDVELEFYKALVKNSSDKEKLEKERAERIKNINEDLDFIEKINKGGEFLEDEKLERLKRISEILWEYCGQKQNILSENEIYNLSTRRGTLTAEERKIMEGHMVATMDMLNLLPFPDYLKNVPEYALGHHERMDGKGYPKGIKAGDMSVPARMMAVADVFEALTAADRPYKPAKKLSETMKIIKNMKVDNHLDPDVVDFFITAKVYLRFAEKYLPKELIDEVNEKEILEAKPKQMVS